MNLFILVLTFSFSMGLLSMIYKKTFFLSILLSLEMVLLKVVMFNFMMFSLKGKSSFIVSSIFMLALAAVEASMGISMITLMSREFMKSKMSSLKLLKK